MKVFKEEQRFTQTWLIVLLTISAIVPIALICQEYFKNNTTMSTNHFVWTIILILASISLIFLFKLTTRIDEKGIHYQFFPFHFKFKLIGWEEISKVHIRTYDPIGEYGGWGFKGGSLWNKSKGRALNVSGDIGIQLNLKNNKKLLIGTNKEAEAKRVIATYQQKLNNHV